MHDPIRPAAETDLASVRRIFTHYVLHSQVTFETTPPTAAELGSKLEAINWLGLPFLVAESSAGEVLGYAYCAPYRPQPAYRFTVEESIYVAPELHRQGVGRMLLSRLLEHAGAVGVRQVIAVIADTGDAASVELHRRCGFSPAGRLTKVGFKHDAWLDTILMQRSLAPV